MAQENPQVEMDPMDKPLPVWFMFTLPFYMAGILALLLLPFAKDWAWLEAWILIVTFSITMTIGYSIINKKNPRVLRNRMKMKKEGLTAATRKSAGSDRWFMPLMSIGFFGAMIFPAYAHRLEWPPLPFAVEMVGAVLMNIGLAIMIAAMLQNPFASKILDISQEQNLIDSGLYAKVRHPLYLGGILLAISFPLALGSWHALIPAAIAILSLVIRIKFEEDMLVKGMQGYEDYQKRVKYKLIPKIF